MQFEHDGDILEITLQWFGWAWVASGLVLAIGMGLVIADIALEGDTKAALGVGPGFAIVTYLILAHLVNRTTIVANADGLVVEHGPLPWRSGPAIPAASIRGFGTTGVLSGRSRTNVEVGRVRLYALEVDLADGNTRSLLWGVTDHDGLIETARLLEAHFRVGDTAQRAGGAAGQRAG